ncbi:MAG: hypothetical protein ACOC9Y_10520 [Chloroflexota bacterium]
MTVDTTVTNGRFVDRSGVHGRSVTIHGGRVVAEVELEDVWRTIDASGFLVWPGMVQFGQPSGEQALELARQGVTVVVAATDAVPPAGPQMDFVPLRRSVAVDDTWAVIDATGGSVDQPDAGLRGVVRLSAQTLPDLSGWGELKPVLVACSGQDLEAADEAGITAIEIPVKALQSGDANLWERVRDPNAEVHVSNGGNPSFPLLPFLYHVGHVKHGVSLSRLAEVTSVTPARWYCPDAEKGWIDEGSDGDLAVFDPDTADPYRNVDWPGRVIISLQRGNILFHTGQLHTSSGDGRALDAPWHAN